jgi:hypothetical protein
MNNFIKNISKNSIKRIFNVGLDESRIARDLDFNLNNNLTSQIEQKQLYFYYKDLLLNNKQLPKISDTGFRVFSQTDEDGILLYIFSLIGVTNKLCLDIAFESPIRANTTNLICNLGWTGLLVCGRESDKNRAEKFFENHPDTYINLPKVINKWVTAENINNFLLENNLPEEIDLFSLDIDGVDYWIWKNLEIVKPRVVIVEFQNILGPDLSLTVPYKSDFARSMEQQDFYGASLNAFVKLADQKGYRLVGCNKNGFNAFFIKKELAQNILPTITPQECFLLNFVTSWEEKNREMRFKTIEKLPWIKV